jgi:asparagine synthase (glutamine-hydrolysing)
LPTAGLTTDGTWHQPQRGSAISNRRLSIIDIAGGHQPFVSDDGQVAVVQNGEIFNYVELAAELRRQGVQLKTSSDTEVILRLYEREGISFVSKLNGMFAIAIDDLRQDAMYLVRDRIGVKPLYVADDGQRMLFASEIKAILPVWGRSQTLDRRGPGGHPPLPQLQLHPRALDHLARRAPRDARHLDAV